MQNTDPEVVSGIVNEERQLTLENAVSTVEKWIQLQDPSKYDDSSIKLYMYYCYLYTPSFAFCAS